MGKFRQTDRRTGKQASGVRMRARQREIEREKERNAGVDSVSGKVQDNMI